jgi:hypothetical protein
MGELRHLAVELWRTVKIFRHEGWRRSLARLLGLAYYYLYKIELLVRNEHMWNALLRLAGQSFLCDFRPRDRTKKNAACPQCGSNDATASTLPTCSAAPASSQRTGKCWILQRLIFHESGTTQQELYATFPADIKSGNVMIRLD